MIVQPDIGQSLVIQREGPPKEMLSVAPMADGRRKVRINSSSLSTIQECMRKAKYSLVEGWKAEDEHPATVLGSALHKALELFYTIPLHLRHAPDIETMEQMSYGTRVADEDFDPILKLIRTFIEEAAPLAPLPEIDKRSVQNGVWILHHYLKAYKDDPYLAYEDDRGPFIERTFSLVIHDDADIQIELFGTIDFAWKHVKTGDILVGDHKSTSSLGWGDQSYYDREKPNHQYSAYMLGAQKVFGLNVSSFAVNVLEIKSGLSRDPKKTGANRWLTPPKFPRQITSRSDEDFAEMIEVFVYYVRAYLEGLKTGTWPLGPVGSCTSYGKCTYREVCAAPPSLRENILNSKFVRLP